MSSYQNYKHQKNNTECAILNTVSDNFKQLKKNLDEYLDNQTKSNLPLTFPQNEGMRQAFGHPTSRQQVVLLHNWFDYQISKAASDNIQQPNEPTLLTQDNDFVKDLKSQEQQQKNENKNIQELLEFTLREIINQVYVQCQERGFLLEKVIEMLLGLSLDQINKMKKEKNTIKAKAVSQIIIMRDTQRNEVESLNENTKKLKERYQRHEIDNNELTLKLEQLSKQIDELKIKKKQLQRVNNHLIDSLIIKQNEIKQVTKKIKMFQYNEEADKGSIIDEQKKAFKQVEERIITSRRGSKLFQPTENKNLKRVQEDLKTQIGVRVRKLLDQSQIDDEEDNDESIESLSGGFNPQGNINSGIQYLQKIHQKQSSKNLDLEDAEKNIKKLLSVKVKIENLHDEANLQNIKFPISFKASLDQPGERTTKGQNMNANFITVESLKPQLTQKAEGQYSKQSTIQPDSLKGGKAALEISNIKKIDEMTVNSSMLLEKQALINNNMGPSQNDESLISDDDDSSVSYSNKSMQFPEDDILTENDFHELVEEIVKAPPVIIIKDDFSQTSLDSPKKRKIPEGKFSKKAQNYTNKPDDNQNEEKPLFIDLNLKKFSLMNQQERDQFKEEDINAVYNEQLEIINDEEGSNGNKSDISLENESPKGQQEQKADGEQLPTVKSPQKQPVMKMSQIKEEVNKFMQLNEEKFVDEINQQEGFNMVQEIDEEQKDQYEEITEKNAIFYKEAKTPQKKRSVETAIGDNAKSSFVGKVDNIVDIILDNVKTNSLSKRQLLQLVVSNILKNEQEEIKQMIIEQFFGTNNEALTPGLRDISNSPGQTGKIQQKDINNLNLPQYLLSRSQDQGCQTDALLMIDFLDCGISPAEVFKFDRKSQKLYKYVFLREDDQDIVKQQEFVSKYDNMIKYYDEEKEKQEIQNPIMAKLYEQAKSAKFEIDRSNIILAELLHKIREYEEYLSCLRQKKDELEEEMMGTYHVKDRFVRHFDLYVNSWHRGFVIGFERGMSAGYFKGAVENKDYGVQEGYHIGLKDGWSFGFDDGFKNGIRKIYQEAKDKGMDVNLLTPNLHLYLSQIEKRQGIQQQIQQRLFKISTFKNIAPVVKRYIDKFNNYNDKKKRHYAKLGLKSVIKMIKAYYTMKIGEKDMLLSEFIFEEFQKKFGHNKMANKAFIQFISSAYYHMKMHVKIALFCSFMLICEKPFSNDVCNFYIQVIEGLQNSKIGLKNEYDEKSDHEYVSLNKAIEVMKDQLEVMLPFEIIQELRKRVEKMQIKGKKSNQAFIDLDKFMDFMVRSYIKFHIDLFNKPQLIYYAWTLYEKNSLSMNEVYLTFELLTGDRFKMLNEQREAIEMQSKEILKIFEDCCKEDEIAKIRYSQFISTVKDSDIFHSRSSKDIFNQLPFRGPVQKFQELYQERSGSLKALINEIYQYEEVVERMDKMDTKDEWINRLFAIERNIGEVNSTLLLLSLILIHESLMFIREYKNRTIKMIWEERNGKKAPKNVKIEDLNMDNTKFQERNIKVQIQSKVQEVIENASPTFIRKKIPNKILMNNEISRQNQDRKSIVNNE